MAQNITLMGANYSDVPSVLLPKTGGGQASFVDVTATTATASDVASGKVFFNAQGQQTTGSASGGGSDSFVIDVIEDPQDYGLFTYNQSFADMKSAIQAGKNISFTSWGDAIMGCVNGSGYYTNYTVDGRTFAECVSFQIVGNESGRFYNAYYGYSDGYLEQSNIQIFMGSATAPATISGTGASVTANNNSLTLSKAVSVTPSVTEGYVNEGTAGNSNVSLSASVTTQGATTYRASTSQQTISSDTYLTGTQTIAPVSQTNLEAGNIKSGTTISISNGQSNIWSVTGTYTGSGGSGIGTLLNTTALGSLSTSSTQASNTNKSVVVTGINDYDLLIVETSVDSATNNRHTCTTALIWLTGDSNVSTKNGATIASNKWNSKKSSNGTTTTRQSTSSYGVYPNSCTITTTSSGTATMPMYMRYNSTSTGTLNGTYTTRVYGVNLYSLIGG